MKNFLKKKLKVCSKLMKKKSKTASLKKLFIKFFCFRNLPNFELNFINVGICFEIAIGKFPIAIFILLKCWNLI